MYSVVIVFALVCTCCTTSREAVSAREHDSEAETNNSRIIQVATGLEHTCKLARSGQVTCWGPSNEHGQLNPPAKRFEKITAGVDYTCGLVSGHIFCWGLGTDPHDSAEAESSDVSPVFAGDHDQGVPPEGDFVEVDAGWNHTCGVRVDKQIVCWGMSGRANDAPKGSFEHVSVGLLRTCALTEGGEVLCWDRKSNTVRHLAEVSEYVEVETGRAVTCGRTSQGKTRCWVGLDAKVIAAPTEPFVDLSVGTWHACGIQTDRTVTCWSVVPGQKQPTYYETPSGTFSQLSTKDGRDCAVADNGEVECWTTDPFAEFDNSIR